jgi:hypothetical protein
MPCGRKYSEDDFVAIAQSGHEAWRGEVLKSDELHAKIKRLFEFNLTRYFEEMKRTMPPGSLDREGRDLTNQFREMKRDFINRWRMVWNALCPGGACPSGKALTEMQLKFKQQLWAKLELGAVETKEKGAELDERKHVGKRVRILLGNDGLEGKIGYWGVVAAQKTTLKLASIRWDIAREDQPATISQSSIKSYLDDALAHQEEEEEQGDRVPAKKRSTVPPKEKVLKCPDDWSHPYGLAWDKFGPWGEDLESLCGEAVSGVGMMAISVTTTPGVKKTYSRLDQRKTKLEDAGGHNEAKVAKKQRAVDAIDLLSNGMVEMRSKMEAALLLEAHKNKLAEYDAEVNRLKSLWEVSSPGSFKDKARIAYKTALQAPRPVAQVSAPAPTPASTPPPVPMPSSDDEDGEVIDISSNNEAIVISSDNEAIDNSSNNEG